MYVMFRILKLYGIFSKYTQGEAHKMLQSDITQTIDHIQECFRQKFQCSRTQGHSSHAKYENSRKIETYQNNHFQRIH